MKNSRHPGRKNRLHAGHLAIAIGIATAVAVASGQGKAAGFTGAPCLFGADLPAAADHTLTCGYVEVPAQHNNPAGEKYQLHVAWYRSTLQNRKPDPVVVLNGGPGQRTASLAPIAHLFVGALAPERDMILFDQRGVGGSKPRLDCDNLLFDFGTTLTLDMLEQNRLLGNYVKGCFTQLEKEGVDLGNFNTVESAADVADIAAALQTGPINLYGVSYGSRLAQEVMRRHPEVLRSVVLDAVVSTDANYLQNREAIVDHALRQSLARCAADEACSTAFPDLQNRLQALADRLDQQPLEVTVMAGTPPKPQTVPVTPAILGSILMLSLYSTPMVPVLPAFINAVDKGDTELLTMMMQAALGMGGMNSIGMQFAFGCNDLIPFARPEDQKVTDPLKVVHASFQGSADLYGGACAGHNWHPLDASTREGVKSDVPALVFSGELDPVTPPRYAKQVMQGLTRARLVTFPDGAHGTFSLEPDNCAGKLVKAFLDDPLAQLETGCAAQTRPFLIQP